MASETIENNAAAIREALVQIVALATQDQPRFAIISAAETALAKPERNCDAYSHDEALSVWAAEKENGKNGCFDEWLYAPATKQKGETDGSK